MYVLAGSASTLRGQGWAVETEPLARGAKNIYSLALQKRNAANPDLNSKFLYSPLNINIWALEI